MTREEKSIDRRGTVGAPSHGANLDSPNLSFQAVYTGICGICFTISRPPLHRTCPTKSFFALISFLLVCTHTLTGCGYLQASTDYKGRQLILVVPIVNRSDKTLLPDEYYDERLFSPNWDAFSESGYTVVYATYANVISKGLDAAISDGLYVSPQSLELIISGSHSGPVAPDEYSYVIVLSVDSIKATVLGGGRKAQVSVFLINNRDGSLYWSNKTSVDWWRGLLGGTLEAGLSSEDQLSRADAIGRAVTRAMSECPLLSGS